jgi:4-diphosphocytidyl-2-C-methyl-D-erythritol kinase
VLAALTNDFAPVVREKYPAVDEVLRALDAADAPHPAMLSGSGGACFALFADEATARAFAGRLRAPAGAAVHVVPFATSAVWR